MLKTNIGWKLTSRHEPDSRLDLANIIPQILIDLDDLQIAKLKVFDGNSKINFGDCFKITRLDNEPSINLPKHVQKKLDGPSLVFEGDLRKVDYIGSKMTTGKLFIDADVGDYLGFSLSGGYIEINGSTGIHTACEMSGGILKVFNNVGDYGGSALPGKIQGVTGGIILVDGNVGDNFANNMRRGLVIILGKAGRYLGSRMVAGTIVVAGKTGSHCGFGMKRGTIIFPKSKPEIPSTFVKSNYNFSSYWGIIASDIQKYDQLFSKISKTEFSRVVGDIAFGGKGEWFFIEK